jgi:hypothetical protein
MLTDQVQNPCGLREEGVPKKAPVGTWFYIVTPTATATNRKYLYDLKRNKPPVWFHAREKSMAFNRIEIANSFCRFIRETWIVQAYVVLEPGDTRVR